MVRNRGKHTRLFGCVDKTVDLEAPISLSLLNRFFLFLRLFDFLAVRFFKGPRRCLFICPPLCEAVLVDLHLISAERHYEVLLADSRKKSDYHIFPLFPILAPQVV